MKKSAIVYEQLACQRWKDGQKSDLSIHHLVVMARVSVDGNDSLRFACLKDIVFSSA